MWVVLRHGFTRPALRPALHLCVAISTRRYASKGKQRDSEEFVPRKRSRVNSTENLIPSSQRILTDETAQVEYDKASTKMSAAVDWYKKEAAGLEARGVGRVTPAILGPVRVALPDTQSDSRLEEIATVGVREGTNLIVTLFDEEHTKHVEKAIYAAKLPNVVPQRMDARTIKVVIPRPTIEARTALLKVASQTAEDTRVQIRKIRDTVVRKHKWKPRSEEIEQFQKLCDMRIKEVDKILSRAKEEMES